MDVYPENEKINIKIKTLNNQMTEFKVHPNQNIFDFKKMIEKQMTIPIDRQRLIFQGKLLLNNDTFQQLKIQEGHVIQLIANQQPQQQINQDDIQSSSPLQIPQGFSTGNLEETDNVLGFNFNPRTINDAQEHRRQNRRRVLQQRIHGFPHLPSRTCPALHQNLQTIKHLLYSLNTLVDIQEGAQVFAARDYDIGMWIDAKDPNTHEWQEAQILQKHESHLCIKFLGSTPRDPGEWINANSPRLAPFRSHTAQNIQNQFMSPTPSQAPILPQNNNNQQLCDLVGQCALSLLRVGNMMSRLAESMQREENADPQEGQSVMQTLINGMIEEQRRIQEDNDKGDSKSQQENDATSVKSLKSMKSEKISIDYETSSIKSMKSDISKFTTVQTWGVTHILQENITEEEEDSQEVEPTDNLNQNLPNNLSKDSKETSTTLGREWETSIIAAQLAPIADRLGRLLMDLSPYLAMIGTKIQKQTVLFQLQNQQKSLSQSHHMNNISNLSIITNEGSQISSNQIHQSYYFQIPIMLTPQELALHNQSSIQRTVGDNIDIQMHNIAPQSNSIFQNSLGNQSALVIQPQYTSSTGNQHTKNNEIIKQSNHKKNNAPFEDTVQEKVERTQSDLRIEKVVDKNERSGQIKQNLKRTSIITQEIPSQFQQQQRSASNLDQQQDNPETSERKKKPKEVSFSEQIYHLKKYNNNKDKNI